LPDEFDVEIANTQTQLQAGDLPIYLPGCFTTGAKNVKLRKYLGGMGCDKLMINSSYLKNDGYDL